MDIKKALGAALRKIRISRGLTQEDFSAVSSRTYLSTLERGVYSPTVEKLDAIASVLGVHPVTVIAVCYRDADLGIDTQELLRRVEIELREIDGHGSGAESNA
jgi:transcriptional regulator with XRE-family HTH domain